MSNYLEYRDTIAFHPGYYIKEIVETRACLKIHSRQMRAPLRGIFEPNSGYIARYAPFIWLKLSVSSVRLRSDGAVVPTSSFADVQRALIVSDLFSGL